VMILRTLLQAMDEWHSLTSREKGLAGMAQNVRNGYRAAGGAPYGYVLEKHAIGPIRNGVPVTKSTLALSDDAPRVQRYLEQRCAGVARMEAARSSGITTKPSSLVGIEWNALTYAGCTTFGVFHERTSTGAYKGQRKRRPRAEWQIQTGTHKALITREQAEAILAALEGSDHGRAISEARQFASKYLLSGLLYTPQGVAWEVNKRTHYWAPRGDGPARYLPIAAVEKGIVEHVVGEIRNAEFARALVALSGGGTQRDRATESKALHKRVAELARTIDRAVTQSLEVDDPAPYQRKIEALERERRGLVEQQWALQEEIKLQAANHAMSVGQMREVLDEFAEQFADADPAAMKQALRSTVERIELDPDTLTCAVHFAIAGRGINPAAMALLRKRPESGVYSQPIQAYRRRLVFRLPYASQRGRYDRGRVRAR
jgi:site-specific DNA recombinase